MLYYLYTDGGARGNPGPAGVGIVIQNNQGKLLKSLGAYIGRATNNQAEYQALIMGLGRAAELAENPAQTEIKVYLDSELLVRQLTGLYRVKNKELKILFLKAQKLIRDFKKVSFSHTPRSNNKQADQLVNQAIDRALKRKTA